MDTLLERFEERYKEVEVYLDFIEGVESLIKNGVPRLGDVGPNISTQQQRILNSSVYLQLYNLVESTTVNCINAVTKDAMRRATWTPADLTSELRHEWIKCMTRNNVPISPENRLKNAIAICDHLIEALPVREFEMEKGGGGNWDDVAIRKIAKRIGLEIRISQRTNRAVKQKIRNDLGAMELIVDLRNGLAHGRLSFSECGQDDSVTELRNLAKSVEMFLREVINSFSAFISAHSYIRSERRPTNANNLR